MAAPDGEVLGVDGRPQRLSHFTRERITVLGFIYTTCVDPEGCPLAYRVFDTVREAIVATPALRDQVRLVTLSFDPARDSPSAMRAYAGSRVSGDAGGLPWYFLTTRSARALMPLVEGFGQDVRYTVDRSSGRPRRELSHVLKVFLIDRAGFIREIYTSTFLHPQTLLNDIETLVMEDGRQGSPERASPPVGETRDARDLRGDVHSRADGATATDLPSIPAHDCRRKHLAVVPRHGADHHHRVALSQHPVLIERDPGDVDVDTAATVEEQHQLLSGYPLHAPVELHGGLTGSRQRRPHEREGERADGEERGDDLVHVAPVVHSTSERRRHDGEILAASPRGLGGGVQALGYVGEGQGGAHASSGLLDEMEILHEEVELHLGREVPADDQRAAHLEPARRRGARRLHVEGDVEIEPCPARQRQRLGGGRAVERDEQVGHQLQRHRLAGGADVDGAGQDAFEQRPPAIEHGAPSPARTMPSPRATIPLVPLIGQSRKPRPRASTSRASRTLSAGEIVLIWTMTPSGFAAASTPSRPRIVSSTAASEGNSVQVISDACAIAAADGAVLPPMSASA